MRNLSFIPALLVSLICVTGKAQAPDPIAFSDLIQGLARPSVVVEVPQLTEAIKSRGIAFELTPQTLGSIISNSAKGKRDPDQVAALILAAIQVCEGCRAHIIQPMTKDQLKTLFTWGFSEGAIFDEARVRGVTDLDVSPAGAAELRKLGAKDDLINMLMPEDKMPPHPPEGGFRPIAIRRAEGYAPTALKGWVKITADFPAKSQSEFVFKHNALFVHATTGEEPSVDLDASSFNKPGPRNTGVEFVDFQVTADSVDQKSRAVKTTAKYVSADADPDGRNAFLIQVANSLNKPQRCAIYLEWTVRTAAKTAPSSTKP